MSSKIVCMDTKEKPFANGCDAAVALGASMALDHTICKTNSTVMKESQRGRTGQREGFEMRGRYVYIISNHKQ